MSEPCRYCGREVAWVCRNTRDMDDRTIPLGGEPTGDPVCFAALMMLGGGERSHNQAMAARLRAGCEEEKR